jgi:hypothetical protein
VAALLAGALISGLFFQVRPFFRFCRALSFSPSFSPQSCPPGWIGPT